jgi:hypothetical protein
MRDRRMLVGVRGVKHLEQNVVYTVKKEDMR